MLLLPLSEIKAQDVFSVGPTFHFNFGDKKPKVSWGVEAALWWYESNNVPVSANLGFDRRKGSTILYTQAQTGVGIAGLSAGPYVEFRKEEPTLLGLQTDYWINYYMGLNYRVRYNKEGTKKAFGLYIKAPIVTDPEENSDGDDDWDWD